MLLSARNRKQLETFDLGKGRNRMRPHNTAKKALNLAPLVQFSRPYERCFELAHKRQIKLIQN